MARLFSSNYPLFLAIPFGRMAACRAAPSSGGVTDHVTKIGTMIVLIVAPYKGQEGRPGPL